MFRNWRVAIAMVIFGCTACVHHPTTIPSCIENRGAIDMGSGLTKMTVAQVDVCEHRIVKVLGEGSEPVSFEADLEVSRQNQLSSDIQTKGVAAIRKLKSQAEQFQPVRWSGVATAAFRKALNTPTFLRSVHEQTHIPFTLISQEQEALLGYRAGMANTLTQRAVIWDIGGGSQQMILMQKDGPVLFRGQMASEPFKKLIIERIQKKSLRVTSTPNPISAQQAESARSLVREVINEIPLVIREALKDPKTKVIGIGGVFSRSLVSSVGKSEYTTADLRQALTSHLDKTDEQFSGEFASLMVSNLILVSSLMEELGIARVHSVRVDLTTGVFVSPEYWVN